MIPSSDAVAAVDGTRLTVRQMARRRHVLDAARALATEGGYDAVHMRDVSDRSGVALGTIYRYFQSKDHLLAAVVSEWAEELQRRLRSRPPRGETPADQIVDVLRRACRALERHPMLTVALMRALGSTDPGVAVVAAGIRGQIREMIAPVLADVASRDVERIVNVVGHVWYSSLMAWANRRASLASVGDELDSATRLLLDGQNLDGQKLSPR